MNVRRFEHPTKHRFWEVYWEATDVEVVSGAIGSNGRAKQYDFASHLDCKQFVEREILKRTKDGFEEVVPEVVQSQKAPRAEPPPVLLARIVEAPDDDQPRMVYADWLQQQGDPLGELIAVQLQIARAESPPKSLRDREDNLLGNYRARWLPGIVGLDVTFVRGFADTVKVDLPFDRAMLDRVVEVAPLIRTLVFAHLRDAWRWGHGLRPWEHASPEALRRFSGIWMGGFELRADGVEALAALDLPRLERLGMRSTQLTPSQLKPLLGRSWVELDLHANSLGIRGLGMILDGDCTRLQTLSIGSNDVMNAGLQLLAQAKPALRRLGLRRSQLASNGLPLLASLPALVSLDLSCNAIGKTFDFALPALRELDVRECELDDNGLRALLHTFGRQLVSLDIGSNRVADPRTLLDAELPALRALNISNTPLAGNAKQHKEALPKVRIAARPKKDKESTSWS
jgi:uncharacterized protein (TIGR02996 family)